MNYLPLAKDEKQSIKKQEAAKHKNPIFSSLKYPQPKPLHTLESEITSSLFFQQLIYFNWYFSFLQCYLYAGSQIYRFFYFNMEFGVPVRTIVGVIFLVLQIFRLQNGFYGNLKQSFPQVCAFVLLTLLTIGGQIILISPMVPPNPMEFSLLLYGIIFHSLQLLCIHDGEIDSKSKSTISLEESQCQTAMISYILMRFLSQSISMPFK